MERCTLATRTIGLYVDLHRPHARETARAASRLLSEQGYAVALPEVQRAQLELDVPVGSLDECAILVSIGGDGTLLRTARLAAAHDVPVLGVNTGRLGFLTELEGASELLAALPRLLQEGFACEPRIALEARVNGGDALFALNEVVVRKGSSSRLVPFGLWLSGEKVVDIPADGVIVASPTGSTAYSLSAGGPIVAPGVDAFCIVPLLPHTLFSRPLVVSAAESVRISVDSTLVHANLETDGEFSRDLSPGDRVEVERSERPVRFVRVKPPRFFTLIEQKLHWGHSIKEEGRHS
ncbi:MAG TPA: NAD(+)/NADH kinase [Candidatus Dormibacteraeota bacterium]|nr:NAD(+)/NADH kinase [Candidatus Dormibacteraeota bacterium]